jgi:hypothetical protein
MTRVPYRPWMSGALPPLTVTMPSEPATVVLATRLVDANDSVLQRNFTTFVVEGPLPARPHMRVASVPATAVQDGHWTLKQWTVLGDRKLNGTGSGFFEYRIPWPAGLDSSDVASATFLVEASAKRLNGKDRDSTMADNGDYMRGGGFHDPSRNPNSYPMTGATPFPSLVTVRVNGQPAGRSAGTRSRTMDISTKRDPTGSCCASRFPPRRSARAPGPGRWSSDWRSMPRYREVSRSMAHDSDGIQSIRRWYSCCVTR